MSAQLASLTALVLVAAPAVAGAVAAALRLGARGAAGTGVAGSALALAAAGTLAGGGFRGVAESFAWAPQLGLVLSWRIEAAPLALALLVAGVGALVLQYAGAYFGQADGEADRAAGRTLALLALFESAMLGLVLADNLFALFVFWEATGLASFFLIASEAPRRADAYPAARQALLVTVAGGLPLLVAVVVLRAATGTASLSELAAGELPVGISTLVLALVLPAVVTKSAQLPLHFWLPGAMAAPSPISAYLHSATMVKAGVILLLFLFPVLGGSPLWSAALVPLGAATCVWGSYRALAEADVKLLLAWSTVSQLGLLTLTAGLGTDLAVRAAVLHLFVHALFKAGLFMTVGAVDHAAHTRELPLLGGLGRRMPLLAAAAGLLAASMAGMPPVAGFLSKELILKKAMLAELWVHAVAIAGIVIGSLGTVAYSSRFFFELFTGEPRSRRAQQAAAPGLGLAMAPVALAAATLAVGLGAPWVERAFLAPVTASLVGHLPDFKPLALFYGVNAALLVSVAILAGGYLFHRWAGLTFLPRPRGGGAQRFEAFLAGSQRLGEAVTAGLAGAHPAVYLGAAILLGLAASLAQAPAAAGQALGQLEAVPAAGAVLVALLVVAVAALVAIPGRLARVLLLSAAGFAVAGLFRLMNAPDLMLTQLLVEVITTVFLVLALRFLPRHQPASPGRGARRSLRAGVALLAGLGAAALVLALGAVEPSTHVADQYRLAGPTEAAGLNLVNVVLTDFRALDTLVETVVVVLAALGVAGLLRRREVAMAGNTGEGAR